MRDHGVRTVQVCPLSANAAKHLNPLVMVPVAKKTSAFYLSEIVLNTMNENNSPYPEGERHNGFNQTK